LYDFFAHVWLPLVFENLVDFIVVIRTIFRKRVGLQNQGAQWQKNRKMVFQLLLLSTLFSATQIPANLITFILLFVSLPDLVYYVQVVCFYYFFYLFTLLLPFACIGCLPEVVNKVKNSLVRRMRRNNTVVAVSTGRTQYRT
jgi:hypothetical protein